MFSPYTSSGSDTTSTFLEYCIRYMIVYPAVQEKVFQELQNTIATDRSVTLEDRLCTPYTEATIQEIMRQCPLMTACVPHCTGDDVTFKGYIIPKGVMGYLYNIQ